MIALVEINRRHYFRGALHKKEGFNIYKLCFCYEEQNNMENCFAAIFLVKQIQLSWTTIKILVGLDGELQERVKNMQIFQSQSIRSLFSFSSEYDFDN